MDLQECRNKLDIIDEEIVKLYEERMDVCKEVAEYKIEAGKNVLDPSREKEKIAKVKALTHNEFNSHGIEELFEQIMSMSRKLQYGMLTERGRINKPPFIPIEDLDREQAKVVFQGTEGSYSQAAMFAYFGETVQNFHVDTFRDAMRAIDEGMADYAVLPIENSSAGIVSENYDLLVEFENYIVAEQIIKIDNCLMGLKGATECDIKTVYSHPQALMQCSKYLDMHREFQQISFVNTAMAAKKIVEDQDLTQAAIASKTAAKCYGLEIMKEQINQSSGNSTRFMIVTNQKVYKKDAKKVSICFEVPHQSGSLYHILSHFIYNNLNMNKIESRPLEDRPWEYRFFIDFDGNLNDSGVRNALRGLREETRNMKILGNY
jgi:chorismate mutase/prephenate dehydratase